MRKIIDLIRQNRLTTGMIAALLFFYVFFAAADLTKAPSAPRSRTHETRQAKLRELKSREDIFKNNLAKNRAASVSVSLGCLAIFLAGLGVDIYLLTAFLGGRPWISENISAAEASWGLRDVTQIFVFLFFSEACIAILEILLSSVVDLKRVSHDFFLLLNSLLRDMAAAAFVVYLVKKKFGRALSDIGLTTRGLFLNLKRGLVGYLGMIPVLILSLFILALAAQFFSYEPMPQDVVQIYLRKSTDKFILPLTIFVTILGPMIEEVFFRGFTYKAFRRRFGAAWAAVATAVIFAAFHMNVMAFFPIFVLGLFLAYLFEKTGSLAPSITAHVTHNLIMVALTLGFRSLSG